MTERMRQMLDSLRRQIGESQWDGFVEACYDAFGKYDQLDGENAVLFEQVQNLKRENDRLRCELDRVLDDHDPMTSITDELREYAQPLRPLYQRDLIAIADRIDKEHERRIEEAWRKGLMASWDHLAEEYKKREQG